MEFENKKLRDVADIAAQIMMGEKALHPNQQKLDVHEPEKDELTAKDFEMLRNKKKVKEETEEVAEETIEEGTPAKNTDVADKSYLKDMGKKPTVASDLKNLGRFITGKKETKEEVEQIMNEMDTYPHPDSKEGKALMKAFKSSAKKYPTDLNAPGKSPTVKQTTSALLPMLNKSFKKSMKKEEIDHAAEFVLEYESKDGKFVHRARPGAYGGAKDEKHAVDTLAGPKAKELKAIESEKKKKMSEMVATYKEQGLKGLFESLKKEEVIVEEPTSAEFDAQLADAKQRAAGTKKQAEVSKPAVQAVQNEETHTTVEFIDYNDVNGVKISEIDLDERTLTEPESKKKEEIVKSMKKGISGFKERYGKDAKSVMYATATKQAKGE
jgi:hypothetical protein